RNPSGTACVAPAPGSPADRPRRASVRAHRCPPAMGRWRFSWQTARSWLETPDWSRGVCPGRSRATTKKVQQGGDGILRQRLGGGNAPCPAGQMIRAVMVCRCELGPQGAPQPLLELGLQHGDPAALEMAAGIRPREMTVDGRQEIVD